MEIDRPTSEEIPVLVDLWVELAADQRAHGSHVLSGENEATVRRTIGDRIVGDRAFVARADGAVVGFVTVGVEDDAYRRDCRRGYVENVYVLPAYRGRGIGTALLDRAEETLSERDVDVVALDVLAANEAARRLYERRGYDRHRLELEKPLESDTD